MTHSLRKRGYVLLTVLWSLVVIAAAATAATLAARTAIATATNRSGLIRAQWIAEGCANVVRGDLEEWMRSERDLAARWSGLDSADMPGTIPNCRFSLRPAGMSLNVNRASLAEIGATLGAAGLGGGPADSLAAAIDDWRDADSSTQKGGAEAEWYAANHRLAPRNGAFVSPAEILLVRGAEWLPGIDTLFATENDAVVLTRASAAVLAGLPGVSGEAVQAILAARGHSGFPDLGALAGRLGEGPRQQLLAQLPALRAATTGLPAIWLLRVTARSPLEDISSTIELRLARDGDRIAIVRKRTWP
jgi:type II secretory pathway component PulK